jgi:rare lipoprotein A
MLSTKNSVLGKVTQSRTALAVFAATFVLGGSATEASAKSERHYHGHSHFDHARVSGRRSHGSWRDANAAIAPSSASSHSFSGVASFYGNESGSQTASGQRFNQNAMTCAHRSLPFGTKLRVSHGDRSVVVTVNDRGPFVHGRVLDLSTAAAHAIGLDGIGRVTAEVVS